MSWWIGLAAVAAILAAHGAAGWTRRADRLLALGAFDLLALVLVLVARDPDGWRVAMREDGVVEWGTFYVFVLAGLAYLSGLRRAGGLGRIALLALGAFCLFVAGEEISWGQRLFAFQPPEIFLEENYQQEFNVHNLLMGHELLDFALDSKNLVALIAGAWGLVGGGLLAPALRRAGPAGGLAAWLPDPALAGAFGAVAWMEIAYPMDLSGEAAELGLGLLFLLDAWLRRPGATTRRGRLALVAGLAGLTALSAATPGLLDRLLYGSDAERAAQARAELDRLAGDLARPGATTGRLRRKSRVHKRVYTALEAGYLRFGADGAFLEGRRSPGEEGPGEARRDRLGYFLDPWNDPYWVLWTGPDEPLVVYSFGPNRRRDSRTRPGFEAGGDDVFVEIPPR